MYKCDECGNVFDDPSWESERLGEAINNYCACPFCKSDLISEAVMCERCQEYTTSEICDECKAELTEKMMVFEKWAGLTHNTFIDWLEGWIERNW